MDKETYVIYGAKTDRITEIVFYSFSHDWGYLFQSEDPSLLVQRSGLEALLQEPSVILLETY